MAIVAMAYYDLPWWLTMTREVRALPLPLPLALPLPLKHADETDRKSCLVSMLVPTC